MKSFPKEKLRGLHFGIIGAGRSGLAAARLLRSKGAHVLVSDQSPKPIVVPAGIDTEVGGHTSRLLQSDVLVRSPGVPGHLSILREARRRNIPVWSELELASRLVKPALTVAITGTNGKTTTTTLVGQLFAADKRKTLVGGNIGTPLSHLARRVTGKTTVVLEVSSYQLEDIHTFHPTISVILNVTPDHLEHHGSMRAYAAAKARIFELQRKPDICIINYDDPWCRRLAEKSKAPLLMFSRKKRLSSGVFFDSGIVYVRWGKVRAEFPLVWNLPGLHNVENALASIACAVAGHIPLSVTRRVLKGFKGVENRLQTVRDLRGVRYINDSKATNVDSTRVALESFQQPLLLIMGGRGKGSPYRPLASLIKRHVKAVLLIGEDSGQIARELKGASVFHACRDMSGAVRRARALAQKGDVVLLSPACASFDQYKNYEERGTHFKALVKKLT